MAGFYIVKRNYSTPTFDFVVEDIDQISDLSREDTFGFMGITSGRPYVNTKIVENLSSITKPAGCTTDTKICYDDYTDTLYVDNEIVDKSFEES